MKKYLFPILLLLHLLFLSQVTFTAWPEMLTYPYLLGNGFSYKDAVIPYPTGLLGPLILMFKTFGFTVLNLKIFTWIVILLDDLVLFSILKKLSKNYFLIYFFLSLYIILQTVLDGNMMWFDNATVLPLLLGLNFALSWEKNLKKRDLFLSVVSFSFAMLVKHIGIIYLAGFLFFYLIKVRKIIISEILFLGSAVFVTLSPFLGYLVLTNSFYDFFTWSLYYPLTFWSKVPGYVRYGISKRELFVTGILSLPFLVLTQNFMIFKDKKFLLNFILLICAISAIYPRFSYFHLQPTLALALILYFQIVNFLGRNYKRFFLELLVLIVFGITLVALPHSLNSETRFYTDEEKELTDKVKKVTDPGEKIYLIGPYASIYVFADRLPSKPWVDNFNWYMEIPGVQEKVISGMEKEQVKVIFRNTPADGQWYELEVYQPRKIIEYMQNKFDLKDKFKETEIWIRKS